MFPRLLAILLLSLYVPASQASIQTIPLDACKDVLIQFQNYYAASSADFAALHHLLGEEKFLEIQKRMRTKAKITYKGVSLPFEHESNQSTHFSSKRIEEESRTFSHEEAISQLQSGFTKDQISAWNDCMSRKAREATYSAKGGIAVWHEVTDRKLVTVHYLFSPIYGKINEARLLDQSMRNGFDSMKNRSPLGNLTKLEPNEIIRTYEREDIDQALYIRINTDIGPISLDIPPVRLGMRTVFEDVDVQASSVILSSNHFVYREGANQLGPFIEVTGEARNYIHAESGSIMLSGSILQIGFLPGRIRSQVTVESAFDQAITPSLKILFPDAESFDLVSSGMDRAFQFREPHLLGQVPAGQSGPNESASNGSVVTSWKFGERSAVLVPNTLKVRVFRAVPAE